MYIAVLSDTHNRVHVLKSALELLRQYHVDTVFHCGDVTTLETARWMEGFTVHYVFGNGDEDPEAITSLLIAANPASTGGFVYTGELAAVRVAATHGHLAGKVNALASSGEYDYVFHGHTHIQRDVILHNTRIINPGALGAPRYAGRTLCILDLATGQANYPRID